mgnify:CR=1 FL=1
MAKAKESSQAHEFQKPADGNIITTGSAMDTTHDDTLEAAVKKKLISLFTLQLIDAQADRIRNIRGELPLEVQDLEDEVEGLETRLTKYNQEIAEMQLEVSNKKNAIKESNELIKKYEAQQMNVRNNREFDSLSKEIEFQSLEIQLSEKKIKEFTVIIEGKKEMLEKAIANIEERKNDLEIKKGELKDIIEETRKEEELLLAKSAEQAVFIDERLLTAYKRIRENARNGLAVVAVERDACGGCFNKIPPQRQLDIRLNKKIIVCEYCGRILVDNELIENISI